MTAIDKVINIAEYEVGYLEKASNSDLDSKTANAGNKNYTKYARDIAAIGDWYNFSKQGFEWCTQFVDWCLIKAFGVELARIMKGLPAYSLGASCTQTVKYYKAIGRFSRTPQRGAQIFFGKDDDNCEHTGIVTKVDDAYVYTVEGNTSGASGVIPNGGGVCAKKYARNYYKIVGYGMPRYELYEEEDDMTKDEVKTMLEGEGTKPSKWAEDELKKAIENGITDGSRPQGYATRQEVACMVNRNVEKVSKLLKESEIDIEAVVDAVSDKLAAKIIAAFNKE